MKTEIVNQVQEAQSPIQETPGEHTKTHTNQTNKD